MKLLVAALTAVVLCAGAVRSVAREQSSDQLIQKLKKETQEADRSTSDPVGKTKALIRASDILLTLTHRATAEGEVDTVNARLGEYLRTVAEARRTMFDSGRDPHKKTDGFKNLEIALRGHLRTLESIQMALSFDERMPVKEAIDTISKTQTELLEAVLGGKNEPPKKR